DGRVKMADFGLAKPFDVAESSFRTQTGTGMGTPDYAAPEQFDPTTPVDHRADIYALGVMIYQMITGALPRGVWRPPSQRASVSTHWDAIVSRAMQNDPAERYQKASEVKTDVSSIPLAGKEGSADTPARPSSKGDAAAKQNEAHKSMRAPAKFRAPLLIVAAAAVLGIAAFVVFGKKQPPPRQDASASLPPTSPGQPNLTNTGRTKSSQATTNAASHEGLLTIRSITPSSPARLKAGEKVKLQIDFHNPGERVIHIWAHPLKHGVMSNLATTSGSFPTNERNGTVERWFSYKEAGDAEEVRVEMVTESETPSRAIIGKVVIPINVTWTGASKPATDTVPLPAATKPPPFVNTLGMKFVPVPGMKVLFSIWDTRVMDYEKYVVAKPDVDGSWKTQQYHGVPVGREPDHPVVAVSWEDAQAFCQWLTEKETAAGTLPPGAKYRLPTDAEWSTAAGLPPERGSTPWERDSQNTEDFPWGKEWPPTQKAGNYADETFHANLPPVKNEKTGRIDNLEWFKDYDDGFAATSPVGRFPANMFGLYDMGGNVWQWCEDWNPPHNGHVLRGGSWMIGVRSYMHSSRRIYSVPHRDGNYGFRCVLELAPAGSTASAISPSPNLPVSASSTKFPPGQWVGLFTKYEELPETLGKAQLKIEERWIRCSLSETGTGLLLPAFTSGAVRARFRVGSAADPTQTKSRIYLRETVTGQSYSQGIIPGKLMCQRREGDRFTKVFETPLPQPVGDGYQIEFGV
ncbi:MAG: SUMF1/EgtB/PvdO family nonheme iron enzyme, partial [Prosthecobacter sp.]|nr:SUMF1/EgtB/PvdO family nonheme iron enzyme [Prosthecobacter sp.]